MLLGSPVPEVEQMFRDELRARGYDEGRNLQIISRYTQGQSDRIPVLVLSLWRFTPTSLLLVGRRTLSPFRPPRRLFLSCSTL